MTEPARLFDTNHIRSRFAETYLPEDPAIPVLPADAHRWPADFIERATRGLTPAGVLIPIMERGDRLSVLLTERSAGLSAHAGQVSFPGGRMEDCDPDIAATALRETEEEVGITRDLVSIAGFLPPSPTVTGYSVTPVVGIVHSSAAIVVDPIEVDEAFEVPLDFLMAQQNQVHSERDFHGTMLKIVEFHYDGHRIWGATASMLLQMRKQLINE